jgi:ribosomal protein S18 acetylase RimI-like enzyme
MTTGGMALSIGELETIAARGWRAPEQEWLGGWLLRAAQGFTGRANSALAAGDPGIPLAEAIQGVRRWYAQRDLPPMVAVPYPLGRPGDSATDRLLGQQGWGIRADPAVVMTAPAAEVAQARPVERVDLDPEPGQAWLDHYHYRGQRLPPIARQLLVSAPFQAFASIRRDGGIVAIGRVAVAAGWGGLTAVEVHPGHRRTGLATAITAALAGAAAAHGAASLYLQVTQGNQAARGLYERLGFTEHHGYHYRVAPPVG